MTSANNLPQFTLLKLLGSGSQGTVYLAERTDVEPPMEIVVKRIPLVMDQRQQEEQIRNLEAQLKGLLELKHDNLVQHFHALPDTHNQLQVPSYLISMEYCSGGCLYKAAKTGISTRNLRKWTIDILRGLEFLHSKLIIHRDINPANIFLSSPDLEKCTLKIGDLGIIKTLLSDVTRSREVSHGKGTVPYMSPEMITDRVNIGRFTDIWSLGCAIIHMATGKSPVFYQINKNGDRVELEGEAPITYFVGNGGKPQYPDNLSTDLKDFLDSCLCHMPNDRLSSTSLLRHCFVTEKAENFS